MAAYLILNVLVLIVVCLALRIRPSCPGRAWVATLVSILLLTLAFDNLLIYLDMFTYASDKILGLHIWLAPVEDFMYAVLAAILIPAVWHKLGDRHAR